MFLIKSKGVISHTSRKMQASFGDSIVTCRALIQAVVFDALGVKTGLNNIVLGRYKLTLSIRDVLDLLLNPVTFC